MTPVECLAILARPVVASGEVGLPAAALLICFALFVMIALRVLVLGKRHYDRVAEVPLHDDRVVEPRTPRREPRPPETKP